MFNLKELESKDIADNWAQFFCVHLSVSAKYNLESKSD